MPEHRQDPQDKQFGEPAARAADAAEHVVHEDHPHDHGDGCGHEAVTHGGHVDYLHDGHRHHAHAGHWDEH